MDAYKNLPIRSAYIDELRASGRLIEFTEEEERDMGLAEEAQYRRERERGCDLCKGRGYCPCC